MVGDILQPTHLLFILLVALLVLGPKRLPEVGKTLGSGLRDFRQAINGESHHDDRAPQAYVEPEPDPVPPYDPDASDADASESDPADLNTAAHEPAATGATTADVSPVAEDPALVADAPAIPTGLHEHELDEPAATDDLQPPAPGDDLQAVGATDDLHGADDGTEPNAVPAPVAAASSGGFASALASSRQRPADGGEPAADDE
jgi:sec-independent protein translocase protein TatA